MDDKSFKEKVIPIEEFYKQSLVAELFFPSSAPLNQKLIYVLSHSFGVMSRVGDLATATNLTIQKKIKTSEIEDQEKLNVCFIRTAALLHDYGKLFPEGNSTPTAHITIGEEEIRKKEHLFDDEILYNMTIAGIRTHEYSTFSLEEAEDRKPELLKMLEEEPNVILANPNVLITAFILMGDCGFGQKNVKVEERIAEIRSRHGKNTTYGQSKMEEEIFGMKKKILSIIDPEFQSIPLL